MALISGGDDGGNGEDSGGVPGGEAAAFEGRFASAKECVIKLSAGKNVRRALSSRNGLHGQVNHCAVSIGFSGKNGCADFMLVMSPIASNEESHRNSRYFRSGDGAVKGVIQIIKIGRVALEVRHYVRIGDDERAGCGGDGSCGHPVTALNELRGKEPDIFLVMKKVFGQRAPGDLFIFN